MPIRLPLRAFALIFPFTLGIACASMSGRASARRDFAYARAGDSIVVAVSTRGRSGAEPRPPLDTAGARATEQESCGAAPVPPRGDRDSRLADDAVAYLEPPRAVAVARCSARQSR
jgi:hypothetical protein